MADVALSLEGVCKQYGDFEAVRDLSFAVKRGTICGFLGPNGAGKTSSVRMMLGLSEPTAGQITVLGGTAAKALDRIGFMPEERGLYRKMTPVDVIVFLAGLKGVKASVARKRGKEMLEAQGLGPFMNKQIRSLSKGMSQKVQLISCLVHEPELVILDEPFSGLDPVNQQGLETVIRDLAKRGATVLFSTHVMQHAERLCEKVVLLTKGQKVFEGSLKEARAAAPRHLDLEGALGAADLMALPGVASVSDMGATEDGAHLWQCRLHAGQSAHEALKAAFLRGLDVRRFEAKEPSLHEAFIVLTGGEADA
ncbi:ABC transporter ATP-binding protein [Asticcacaulis benevestitus]|uniref:ABC transporter ATP-binding protein n=1 Tax=Asticcacaulis benevestitus DSM 16100 = ATCC BAA-896 TaxID=1121022 RepID=V4QR00_9CAUL|nr:ATP-binding cassette domain-containing protein [Asticcacaulis benevestitus]ESQ81593.1 ABC transporter ATP-binding protein [Asticcacaulis benevestitus DSM 16100 = ATCC BAA-896]